MCVCVCVCVCLFVCVCVCVCNIYVLDYLLYYSSSFANILYFSSQTKMCSSLSLFFLCLLLYAMSTHAQIPHMEYIRSGDLTDMLVRNNSFVNHGLLSSTPLKCLTNLESCCANPVQGDWTNPDGSTVHQGQSGASDFYVTRGSGVVNLNRISGGSNSNTNGIWRCDIPDVSGISRSLYVYLGDSESGE